jgi:hypothetical protein
MNENKSWRDLALNAVEVCALRYSSFTTDQVEVILLDTVPRSRRPDMRSLGSIMLKAQRKGWISKTDRVLSSAMPTNHRRAKRVWLSQIRKTRR